MDVRKINIQELEEEFQIMQKNENGSQGSEILSDLYERYGSIENSEELLPVDEILAMFNDNGERIELNEELNVNWDELLEYLETHYGGEDPTVDYLTVEELLDKFEDNGNLLEDLEIAKNLENCCIKVVDNLDELTDSRDYDNPAGRAGAHCDRSGGQPDQDKWENVSTKTTRKRKRIGKRGGRGKRKSGDKGNKTSLKIFHCNVRGFKSKKESLIDILDRVKPDVVNLNE